MRKGRSRTLELLSMLGEGRTKPGKEKAMSNNQENRVLSRRGARELTQDETQGVTGGVIIPSLLSVIRTGPATNPDHSLDE